jgi:beta-fructofuranosidase
MRTIPAYFRQTSKKVMLPMQLSCPIPQVVILSSVVIVWLQQFISMTNDQNTTGRQRLKTLSLPFILLTSLLLSGSFGQSLPVADSSSTPQNDPPADTWALELTVAANARWDIGQSPISAPAKPLSIAVTQEGATRILQFQLFTTSHDEPLSLGIPTSLMSTNRPHKLLLRYLGYKLDLFCDGVLVDEEWPMGQVNVGSSQTMPTVHGPVQLASRLPQVPSEQDIETRYGGKVAIAKRAAQMFGPEILSPQYRKPRGWNTNAGDAMPFYHDGTFHLFYLIDRRHHHSKWGLGAHQWAHIASKDLVHWTTYPIALPITHQWEGSICTGSVFYNNGVYYAFYATRLPDRKEHLAMASSSDGVHFQKVEPTPFRGPEPPFREGPNRDPSVFHDNDSFLMLVTAALAAKKDGKEQGALEQLSSKDLKKWSASDKPFLVPGYSPQPECSDLFLWRGRYYLLFGVDGVTHYRIANTLRGPWTKPEIDTLDAGEARVMKSAPFHNDRRILVGWIGYHNFGGNLIFRELIQNADGSLGTKFVKEMDPESKVQISVDLGKVTSLPRLRDPSQTNLNILLKNAPRGDGRSFGLVFQGENGRVEKLIADPKASSLRWLNADGSVLDELTNISPMDITTNLQVTRQGDLVDLCVNNHRTMIHRLSMPTAQVSLSSEKPQ